MHLRLAALGLLSVLGCSEERSSSQGRATSPASLQQVPAAELDVPVAQPVDDAARAVFDDDVVRTYALTIAPANLAKLNKQPSAEQYVSADLRVDDGRTQRVAVRYKGSVGAFLPPCTAALGFLLGPKEGKCSLKLAFDEYDEKGRLHGLKKLNLHAMTNDPSMLLERLAYGLFRDMGIAASRTAHVRVTINGALEGLFLAVEEPDGRFTRSRFPKDGDGNLYKEVWPVHDDPQVYRAALETNKKAGDVAKFRAFAAALRADATAATASSLDREYMLRYLAVDRVIMNDDGPFHLYCVPFFPGAFVNHNYLWYEAGQETRFWLVPWDLDHALGIGRGPRTLITPVWWQRSPSCACEAAPNGLPTLPSACDPLIRAFADQRTAYEATVEAFLKGPFSAEKVDAKLADWVAQIAPHVSEAAGVWGAPSVAQWQRGLEQLRENIATFRTNRGYKYD